MSYILDALKKSEKERQRKSLPDIMTVQDIVSEKPARPYLAYFFTAALILNAGIFIWWLSGSHTINKNEHQVSIAYTEPASPVNVIAQSVPDRAKPPSDFSPSARSQMRNAEENSAPVTKKIVPAQSERGPAILMKSHAIQDVRIKSMSDLPGQESLAKAAPEPAPEIIKQAHAPGPLHMEQESLLMEVPDQNRIYKLRELPPAVLSGLPTFSVSALLFSENPASRVVRINEHMMHEGQELTPGIRLEEITRDGMVLSYRKYRFYVGAK